MVPSRTGSGFGSRFFELGLGGGLADGGAEGHFFIQLEDVFGVLGFLDGVLGDLVERSEEEKGLKRRNGKYDCLRRGK